MAQIRAGFALISYDAKSERLYEKECETQSGQPSEQIWSFPSRIHMRGVLLRVCETQSGHLGP